MPGLLRANKWKLIAAVLLVLVVASSSGIPDVFLGFSGQSIAPSLPSWANGCGPCETEDPTTGECESKCGGNEKCKNGRCCLSSCPPDTCGYIRTGCGDELKCGEFGRTLLSRGPCRAEGTQKVIIEETGCLCKTSACLKSGIKECDPDPCAGAECGTIEGKDCGSCGGKRYVCESNQCVCHPKTKCPNPGNLCGSKPDGCGGTVDCGGCPGKKVCKPWMGTCCKPKTCPPNSCGTMPDGCGGTLDCGSCPSGKCNPKTNSCCEPKDSCPDGAECGSVPDGCGGTLNCGSDCDQKEMCEDNECEPCPLKESVASGGSSLEMDGSLASTSIQCTYVKKRVCPNGSAGGQTGGSTQSTGGTGKECEVRSTVAQTAMKKVAKKMSSKVKKGPEGEILLDGDTELLCKELKSFMKKGECEPVKNPQKRNNS